jgi:hypothetical protein
VADVIEQVCWVLPKQLEVLAAPQRSTTLFCGGVGYGKTRTMGAFAAEEGCTYPNNQYVVASSTLPQLKMATIPKLHEFYDEMGIWYDYSEYRQTVTFGNGSWYKYQSLDVPNRELEGSELGALLVDEVTACPEQQVRSLMNRVRRKGTSRRVLLCGNPPEPGHWLEKAFLPDPMGESEPWGKVVTASTYENPLLPLDYIKRLETMYPPGSFMHRRMMLGEMGVSAEGAVYAEFDPREHIVTESEVPWGDAQYWVSAIDLGHGDPFVWLAGFFDSHDVLWVFDEYYCKEPRVMAGHAMAIRQKYRGGLVVCDYGAQERLELSALGVNTVPAHKDILMGIHAVRARMANGMIRFVRGRTPNLMREMPTYIWHDGDKPKSKEGDHALDTLRYIVAAIDLAAYPSK